MDNVQKHAITEQNCPWRRSSIVISFRATEIILVRTQTQDSFGGMRSLFL
jgi:hypothetical protein